MILTTALIQTQYRVKIDTVTLEVGKQLVGLRADTVTLTGEELQYVLQNPMYATVLSAILRRYTASTSLLREAAAPGDWPVDKTKKHLPDSFA